MSKNYFKKDWYEVLKIIPEDIRGDMSFAFLKYLYDNESTYFEDKDNQRIFNILKIQIDKYKQGSEKEYLYIIKCYNESESFYKYGVTDHFDISNRFSFYNSTMPYNYDVIIQKKKTKYFNPVKVEKKLKVYTKGNRYKPLMKFGGYTECFNESEFNNVNKIINNG